MKSIFDCERMGPSPVAGLIRAAIFVGVLLTACCEEARASCFRKCRAGGQQGSCYTYTYNYSQPNSGFAAPQGQYCWQLFYYYRCRPFRGLCPVYYWALVPCVQASSTGQGAAAEPNPPEVDVNSIRNIKINSVDEILNNLAQAQPWRRGTGGGGLAPTPNQPGTGGPPSPTPGSASSIPRPSPSFTPDTR